MPKTKPGLEKIRGAVLQKSWFKTLDPKKIITVAGTNGKGTTCACLEALLISAGKRVGLYTSPHLVQTTERIRVQGIDISKDQFCQLFEANLKVIESEQLSHFESLTLMAADYFFSDQFLQNLDYAIFEVGLGGTFDATNVFPNHYAVITALGIDHVDILGHSIESIAENKFGIVKSGSVVVHQKLPDQVVSLKTMTEKKTQSQWTEAKDFGHYSMNLLGARANTNANTALTLFELMGFKSSDHIHALKNVRWPGRMQKVHLKNFNLDAYLSGDHNPQGVDSLLEIVRTLNYENIHFIVGVGKDKNCSEMLTKLLAIPKAHLYLTETPFKGNRIEDYPSEFRLKAAYCDAKISKIFEFLKAKNISKNDCIIVTGSLYLVGQVLRDEVD